MVLEAYLVEHRCPSNGYMVLKCHEVKRSDIYSHVQIISNYLFEHFFCQHK